MGRLAICTLDECLAQLQRIVLKFPGCVHNWAGWRFVRWMGVGCGGPCVEVSGFGCGWSGRVGLGWRGVRWARCTLDGARVDCNGSWCVTDWRDVRWLVSGSVLRFQVLFLGGSIVMGARIVRVAGGGRSDWLQLNGDILGHLTPPTE